MRAGKNDEDGLPDAAFTKLAEVVKLLDSAGEQLLADAALELAEKVNFRISTKR